MKSDIHESAFVECAKFTAEMARTAKERTIDQYNAASRWLLASLFALNGGAILASINSTLVDKGTLVWAAPVFFVGILCAFWMAVMNQNSDRGMISAMSVWGLYWIQAATTGVRDEIQEADIDRKIAYADSYGRKGRTSGVFSMLCFTIGCVIVGVGIIK